jgi:hypothetical protein
MNKKYLSLIIVSVLFTNFLFSQGVGIGEWRLHTPLNQLEHIAGGDGRIYGASNFGILYYDIEDNSLNRLTKVEGLTGNNIADIEYDTGTHSLVVAYTNTNIDIVRDDEIINIPSILHSNISPEKKRINSIELIDGIVYVNCRFGVVLINLKKVEIIDTYYLGSIEQRINVYDIASNDTAFFAVSDSGLYYGLKEDVLSFYENWKIYHPLPMLDSMLNKVRIFDGMIFVNKPSSKIFNDWNNDTIVYFKNNEWHINQGELPYGDIFSIKKTGNNEFGLCTSTHFYRYDYDLNILADEWTYGENRYISSRDVFVDGNDRWLADYSYGIAKNESEVYMTNTPGKKDVFQITSFNNTVVSVSGGLNASWVALFNPAVFNVFTDETWKTFSKSNVDELAGARDLVSVVVNPQNEDEIFVGSWGGGLFQFDMSNASVKHYDASNSSLGFTIGYSGNIRVGGLNFDSENNLWVTNSSAENQLSVRYANGEWKSFYIGNTGDKSEIGRVLVDSYNQKWILTRAAEKLFVFDEKQSGYGLRTLTSVEGNGKLSGSVFAIAEDQDGEIWLGTDNGICVIYSPENIFTNNNFDAQPILIPRVDNDSLADILLENKTITSIVVDGANNKWIGTANAGVFKVSGDGMEEIFHFTIDNSPLLSNTILDITINSHTGEVFFGTVEGIVSYKSTATGTGGVNPVDEVLVYPNPVRPGYNGPIAIRGLPINSSFKITDIAGNLVFAGQAEGGQAIWYGKNHSGERVRSGVYLVFSTNDDGKETQVSKILFVN